MITEEFTKYILKITKYVTTSLDFRPLYVCYQMCIMQLGEDTKSVNALIYCGYITEYRM